MDAVDANAPAAGLALRQEQLCTVIARSGLTATSFALATARHARAAYDQLAADAGAGRRPHSSREGVRGTSDKSTLSLDRHACKHNARLDQYVEH